MLRPLALTCIVVAVSLPAAAADLGGYLPRGYSKVMEPAALAGRGRYLAVESPPWDKITTYSPVTQGAGPLQVHRYFGPPQVSYYYSHYGAPQELLIGRPQFGCNYFTYC
ncbi:MAG: hypothetical protein CFE29_26500 [Bradyrhizobiaceae bacterium PARB1]|nr:MAG: hypothetical protein CFE29_26500 [Bradyrhizobiaceae bacterium PARB1]